MLLKVQGKITQAREYQGVVYLAVADADTLTTVNLRSRSMAVDVTKFEPYVDQLCDIEMRVKSVTFGRTESLEVVAMEVKRVAAPAPQK